MRNKDAFDLHQFLREAACSEATQKENGKLLTFSFCVDPEAILKAAQLRSTC
jgi:hypothetical protein